MKQVPATSAKVHFGEMLEAVQREPVQITKKDRPVAVLVSQEEWERLEALEDAMWASRVQSLEATQEYLTPEQTLAFIREALARPED